MRINTKSLRIIFIVSVLLLVALGSVGFYFTRKQLSAYNKETIAKNSEADSTDSKIRQIETAIKYINENKTDIDKAGTITADGNDYQYQDQIIKDIRNIASASHLRVDSISFSDAANGDSAPAAAATPAAPSPTTATPGAADGTPPATTTITSRVKKQTATVTFSPSNGDKLYYQYILDFLYKIQQNSTKFYTADISLKASSKNNETVDLETLSIDVYVKDSK